MICVISLNLGILTVLLYGFLQIELPDLSYLSSDMWRLWKVDDNDNLVSLKVDECNCDLVDDYQYIESDEVKKDSVVSLVPDDYKARVAIRRKTRVL